MTPKQHIQRALDQTNIKEFPTLHDPVYLYQPKRGWYVTKRDIVGNSIKQFYVGKNWRIAIIVIPFYQATMHMRLVETWSIAPVPSHCPDCEKIKNLV